MFICCFVLIIHTYLVFCNLTNKLILSVCLSVCFRVFINYFVSSIFEKSPPNKKINKYNNNNNNNKCYESGFEPLSRPYYSKRLPQKGKNFGIFLIGHFDLQANVGGIAPLVALLITSLLLILVSEQN